RVALSETVVGRLDEARKHLAEGAGLVRPEERFWVPARAAVIEWKAGNAEAAEAQVAQINLGAPAPLAVYYLLPTGAGPATPPPQTKRRFDAASKGGLTVAPDPASANALLGLIGSFAASRVNYLGLLTHTKSILAYVKKLKPADFEAEGPLVELCKHLLALQ